MVGDASVVPELVVIVLPAWLVVTGRPEMVVRPANPRTVDGDPAPA
jgi:hypothetical protein